MAIRGLDGNIMKTSDVYTGRGKTLNIWEFSHQASSYWELGGSKSHCVLPYVRAGGILDPVMLPGTNQHPFKKPLELER